MLRDHGVRVNTTAQDALLCPPADFVVPSGSDVDLTIPFGGNSFNSQPYARGLQNASGGTVIVVVAVNRLDASVIGGISTGISRSIQPGDTVWGQWVKVVTSGSSFSTGQLLARSCSMHHVLGLAARDRDVVGHEWSRGDAYGCICTVDLHLGSPQFFFAIGVCCRIAFHD